MRTGFEGGYRSGLDGVRAIAVAAVVLFHLDRLPGGNLGVDAFFVVSGWLITWKLLGEADASGGIGLRHFWAARARRLMPASLAVLAAVAVAWPLVGISVPSLQRDVLWAAGWASNWGTITGGGDYWARFSEPSPVTHFWSLAIEEQFYLVWPIVLVAIIALVPSTRRRAAVGSFCVVAAALSIATMNLTFDATNPTATYMNTFARGHSLLIGAAMAAGTIVLSDGRLRGGSLARRLAPVACATALAIVFVARSDSTWLFRWGFPVFAASVAVLVVAIADGAGNRVLAAPPMRWVADRSYGLYLWHWPVFLLLSTERLGVDQALLPRLGFDVFRVAVAVALADLSFRFIESPIRQRRVLVRWNAPVAAGVAIVGVFLIAVTVVPGPISTTAVLALPPPSTTSEQQAPASKRAAATLAESPAPADVGDIGDPDAAAPVAAAAKAQPLRVLVAGDSTGVHLSQAMVEYAAEIPEQLAVGSAAFPGCGLSAGADGRRHEFNEVDGTRTLIDLSGCLVQWGSISDRVVTEEVDVVLVSIGPWDAVDIHLADGTVVAVDDPIGAALVADAYGELVAGVESAGASVVWITPPDPHYGWGTIADPLNEPARWLAIRSIIDDLGVEQVDLCGWLTAQGLEGPDGRPDGVHLTPELNKRLVAEKIAPTLSTLAADESVRS